MIYLQLIVAFFERKELVAVAIWYLTTVLSRGEGSRGTPLPLYLVLDENGNVLDLQQQNTISTEPNEPPHRLIEAATGTPGYWADDAEQEFWQQWVMYPDIPEKSHDFALESVRTMVRKWVTVTRTGTTLASESIVAIRLKPLRETDETVLLMELRIKRLLKTVFMETVADPL